MQEITNFSLLIRDEYVNVYAFVLLLWYKNSISYKSEFHKCDQASPPAIAAWSATRFRITVDDFSINNTCSRTLLCIIQMQALAIVRLNYWFQISSFLERTKNSTKTSNTLFERSDNKLFKSWRLWAWHSHWPATPTLYDKLNFLGEEGVASPWCCHAPVLQEKYCPLSGLSNEILYVFVPLLLFQ